MGPDGSVSFGAAGRGPVTGSQGTGEGSIASLLKGLGERYAFGLHDQDGMPQHQVAFTVGVIALGAKMAKADGVVTPDEVLAFKEVFKVPDGEMENVSRPRPPSPASFSRASARSPRATGIVRA
jgi:hypothetical protein